MKILLGLLVATLGLGAAFATGSAMVTCDWKTSPGKTLSCVGLERVNTAKSFTVIIKNVSPPPKTSLTVGYWKTNSERPTAPATVCNPTGATYYCDPLPADGGPGVTLTATTSGVPSKTAVATTTGGAEPAADVTTDGSAEDGGAADAAGDSGSTTAPALGHLSLLTDLARGTLSGNAPAALKEFKPWVGGYAYSNFGPGTAVILLNTLGQPLQPLPDAIDETDDIWIAVVDWSEYMNNVMLSVSGCSRPPVDVRVYGTGASSGTPPKDGAAPNRTPPPRKLGDPVFHEIGKCAGADSGGPVVTVKAVFPGSPDPNSSSVTIPVDPVYRFVIGVGLGADFTKIHSFGVATVPGSTIANITETDDRVGLSSLLFVGFYPFGRDFRKVDYLWQRFELFVALDPKALSQSAIIGGGFNLVTGMDLLVGWRALTRTTVLQPGTGLMVGSPFDGPTSSLPITSVWDTGSVFVGVGVTNALLAKLH
jgi:hypothetical protein